MIFIMVLLYLATNLDWPLPLINVKNALLNEDLVEEVYRELPPAFEGESGGKKVCKLKKFLYGLEQSPLAWFDCFPGSVKRYGHIHGQTYHTLSFKHSQSGEKAILIVYVDDVILSKDEDEEIPKL